MVFKDAVINLFINSSVAKKQLDDMNNRFKEASKDIKSSVLGQFGGFATAIVGIGAIKQVYKESKKISDFSSSFSLPIEEVSKYNNMLSLFGGNSDIATGGLEGIQQAIIDLRTTGGGALRTVASQVGLSMYNMDGSIKNSIQIIEDLRGKFKGLNKAAQLKVAQELGIADPATLRMLRASDEEYKDILEQSKKMTVITKDISKQVQDINRLMSSIRASLVGIGASLLPSVSGGVELVAKGFEKFNSLSDKAKQRTFLFAGALFSLVAAAGIVKALTSSFLVLSGVLKTISLITAANPIFLMIMAAIGGIVLLVKYWEQVKEMFSKSVEFFADIGKKIGESISNIFKGKYTRYGSKSEIEETVPAEKEPMKKSFLESFGGVGEVLPKYYKGESNSNIDNKKIATDNRKSTTSNVFNFNIAMKGSVEETENMINRIIKQNAVGAQ